MGAPGPGPSRRAPVLHAPRGRPTERLLYGINPIREAIRAGRRIHEAYRLASGKAGRELQRELALRKVPTRAMDRHQLSTLCGSPHHQGWVARVEALPNGSLQGLVKDRPEEPLTVLVLDHIQDPQNLGAIYRSADAAGVNLIFTPVDRCASPQLPSVAKASAGAVEHVPTVFVATLKNPFQELKEHGFEIVGLTQEGGVPVGLLKPGKRLCVVLGSEGEGLSAASDRHLDRLVSIPMRGKVNSLNAASAVAIALYYLRPAAA